MKKRMFFQISVFCLVLVLVTQTWAQPPRGRGIYGDWQVKVDFNGRQMESIWSFSRDQDRNWTGQWISFWGLTDLQDVKFEEGQLSFTWSMRGRDGQTITSKFAGKIEEGRLTGKLTSDRGESAVEGERAPRAPRAAGQWQMKLQRGEREFPATLTIKTGEEGQLTAEWRSERGELEISDMQYQRGDLAFKMKSKNAERQWEAAFAGNIRGNTLSGTITSQRGEMKAEGQRVGADLIGTWILDMESERGPRKQRLRVNPDMTGLYGSMPIKKINIENGQVDFKITMEFGERTFELTFKGKIADNKLTGETTTSRGTRKVTGTKVVRQFRRPRPQP